jgi:hypothetical protein
VGVNPLIPGDCDFDGTVDMVDFSNLANCLTGRGSTVDPGCECFDLDEDGSVTLSDFAVFQVHFGI